MKKLLISLNALGCLAVVALAVRFVVMPEFAKLRFAEEFKQSMLLCDDSMRTHLIAKHRVVVEPGRSSINALKSAEVGLLSCHEYDKLRKRLLWYGLRDHEIAAIGLQKLEENTNDVYDFVRTHEFRY